MDLPLALHRIEPKFGKREVMRYALLLSTFLFFIHSIDAQNISATKKGTFKSQYYKLSFNQSRQLYTGHDTVDMLSFMNDLVLEVPDDSVSLVKPQNPGHYLHVRGNRNTLFYSSYSIPFLRLHTQGVIGEGQLKLYDFKGNPVTKAKVSYQSKDDWEAVPFDPGCGCYALEEKLYNKYLTIEYEGGYDLYKVTNKGLDIPSVDRSNPYRGLNHTFPGYMVFNKPKFRHFDTLKMKAFLVTNEGRPIRRKLGLWLVVNGKKTFVAKLKPESPGAYTYNFHLSDSLPLNSTLKFILQHKGWEVKSNQFQLEDYELKKASYASRMLKSTFKSGEKVEVIADALDANGMPMLDTRVKLEVSFLSSDYLYPVRHTTNDTILTKLHTYNDLIDETGTSILQIPNEVFLPIAGQYQVKVGYLNTSGEFKEQTHVFYYDAKSSYYKYLQAGDQLIVAHYLKGKSQSKEIGRLKAYYQNNLLYAEDVSFPVKHTMHPAASRYELWVADSLVVSERVADQSFSTISVTGMRSHDSVKVKLTNPWNIPVYYRIYRNKKIVKKGFGDSLNFKEGDRSMFPYYVLYGYQWAGQEHFYEVQLNVKEKELKLSLDLPEAIFPGERVNGSISVTDYMDRPVKKANLTAWAVNMEFPNIPLPDMPYFGRRFPKMSSYSTFNVDEIFFSGSRTLNYSLLEKLDVADTNYYYQLRYPGKRKVVYEQENRYATPEFTVLILEEGIELPINVIWLNDRLIYDSENNTNRDMVFRYAPGNYQIRIHTPDTLIETTLELKEYKRTYLSIDPSTVKEKTVTIRSRDDSFLSEEEVETLEKQTFYVDYSSMHADTVWVENAGFKWVLKVPGSMRNKIYFYEEIQKNLAIFTGMQSGQSILRVNTDTFYFKFEPGQYYVVDKGLLTHYPLPRIPLNRELVRANTSRYSFDHSLSAFPLYFRTEVTRQIKEQKKEAKEELLEQQWYEYMRIYSYQHLSKKVKARIKFFNPERFGIKYLWLINENEKRFSFASSGLINNYEFQLKPGTYTMVAINSKGKTYIEKGIELETNDFHFQRIIPSRFTETTQATIEPYRELVHELARPAIRKASLFPETLNNRWSFKKDSASYGSILGVLSDESSNQLLSNATVMLEKEGVLKDAVMTNSWGEYIFRDVPAGTYQLKIHSSGFRYTMLTEVTVKNTFTSYMETELERSSDYLRTINSATLSSREFTTIEKAVKGKLKLQVESSDISSGEKLLGAQVAVYDGGSLITGAVTGINGIAEIYDIQPGYYTIEIKYIGYNSVRKNNFEVVEGLSYHLKVPMTPSVVDINEIMIEVEREPLIKESFGGLDSRTRTTEEIGRLPVRGVTRVLATTGGVQSIDGGAPVIRGGRSDQVITYIDGMPVRGNGIPAELGDSTLGIVGLKGETGARERLKKNLALLGNRTPPNRMRTDFRDCGYWVPNLVTDKAGKAYFSVKFPDNITQWQSIIPAMDHHRNTGLLTQTTKAFLPYSAQLGLPRFLVKGDSVVFSSKVFNYTEEAINIEALVEADDVDLLRSKDSISRRKTYRASYVATRADSVQVSFSIRSQNGFKEGEERSLKVFDDFIEMAETKTVTLTKDSTFEVRAQNNEKIGVVVFNDRRQFLLDQIDRLKQYSYGCTEQTASKLSALLAEKTLCQQLGKEFKEDKMVKKMIARLSKFQRINGSWGWWQKGNQDSWMTIYVVGVLADAQKQGYNSFAYSRGMNFLKRRYEGFTNTYYLQVLAQLIELNHKSNLDRWEKMKYEALSDHDKLQYLRIAQLKGDSMNITKEVMKLVKKDQCGVLYWGNASRYFYRDKSATTILALKLLAQQGTKPQMVKAIEKSYFSKACRPGGLNTLQRALLIGFVLENLKTQVNNEVVQGFKIDGKRVISFPKRHEQTGGQFTVSYTGNIEAMVLTYRLLEVRDASPDSALFTVKTHLAQKGKKTAEIALGEKVHLNVETYNRLSANHVMIEVSIPAGFSYSTAQGVKLPEEVHREYRRNKVVIYCTSFPAGKRNFTINLEPRFRGKFTQLPTKVEQMYFPDQRGNNGSSTVMISGE